jgi:F0F1-type ATP synthase assembly protein I
MSDPDDPDDEWQFTLKDLKEREAEAEAREAEAERRREPLEPGDPSLENVTFVLLGVLLALFVVSRLFVL